MIIAKVLASIGLLTIAGGCGVLLAKLEELAMKEDSNRDFW